MAVYTDISFQDLQNFLKTYDIGGLETYKGIAEGVENSNFLVKTDHDKFILTIFEKRMNADELPWFMGLMSHLSQKDFPCPSPIKDRLGEVIKQIAGKPAVIVSFLEGHSIMAPTKGDCFMAACAMADIHLKAQDYKFIRKNSLAPSSWHSLAQSCLLESAKHDILDGIDVKNLAEKAMVAIDDIVTKWPSMLPSGQIHADLFPDNMFFNGHPHVFSGAIDFYFSCTDFLAYDFAILINSWCFQEHDDSVYLNQEAAEEAIKGYESLRPLTSQEKISFSILCQGAALRFFLTRFYDWMHTPKDALVTRKDPRPYWNRYQYFKDHALF